MFRVGEAAYIEANGLRQPAQFCHKPTQSMKKKNPIFTKVEKWGKIIILTLIRIKLKWAYYYQKYSITRDKEGCFMRTA